MTIKQKSRNYHPPLRAEKFAHKNEKRKKTRANQNKQAIKDYE